MLDPERKSNAAILALHAQEIAMRTGDYDRAAELMTQALQFDPDNGEIWHNRGMVYKNSERWSQAVSDFSQAIALSPHPSSYEQRGFVYYQMGDRRAARRDWEHVLRKYSDRSFALINLGWLCIEEGRYRKAIDYCSRAIRAEPTNSKAYENRGRAYIELGEREQAYADLQKARELKASGRDTSGIDLVE